LSDKSGVLYAYEVCDACQAKEFGYRIDGTLVSDFVYPAWFESFRKKGSTQFEWLKSDAEAFECAEQVMPSEKNTPLGDRKRCVIRVN